MFRIAAIAYLLALAATCVFVFFSVRQDGVDAFLREYVVPPCATVPPWLYIAAGIAAMSITGISKGGFGGGVGALSVPLMLQVTDNAKFVIGFWLPLLIICDAATIHRYPKEWNPRAFLRLAPGVLAGIMVATIFLGGTNPAPQSPEAKSLDAWLKLIVAVVTIGFLFLQLRPYRVQSDVPWQPSWRASLPIGLVAGVTTMIAHAAGPIVTMYLLPQKMAQTVFVGTTGRFYFIFNSLKVPFGIVAATLTLSALKYALWLMLLGPLAVWFGAWLNRKLNALWFVRLIQVSLVVAAAKLVYDAVKALGN
jgi:uncharacterized membrane protein YfcA